LVLVTALVGGLRFLLVTKHDDEDNLASFHGWSTAAGENSTRSSNYTHPLHVIYHIGPEKMGSTSIQIGALQKYQQQLHHDGYNIYNFQDASKLNECLTRDVKSCQSGQEWSRFLNFLKKSKLQRRNVVISTENHWNHFQNDTSLLEAYREVFDSHNFHVRIVIGYRPLFDYWPSVYFQNYNHYCGYSHEELRTIPSLLDFIQTANATKQLRHPSYAALQHSQRYFTDIVILSLGNKFVERFLCNAVIGATHACTAVKKDEVHAIARIENAGHLLGYNRLAQAARLNGISDMPCKTLSESIELMLQQLNASLMDLPRTCLDESQQEWLWNKSLYYHHALVPNSTVSDGDLKMLFEQTADTTLCEVNVEQVLAEYPNVFAPKNATGTRVPP